MTERRLTAENAGCRTTQLDEKAPYGHRRAGSTGVLEPLSRAKACGSTNPLNARVGHSSRQGIVRACGFSLSPATSPQPCPFSLNQDVRLFRGVSV
jgi:hypothetical protein